MATLERHLYALSWVIYAVVMLVAYLVAKQGGWWLGIGLCIAYSEGRFDAALLRRAKGW